MSSTVEIWNLSALCRCCHTYGHFKNLSEPYRHGEESEVYYLMLRDTFNVEISLPLTEASYSICDVCIDQVRDAYQFRRQVVECEKKFEEYCKNEMVLKETVAIKIETEEVIDKNANGDFTPYGKEDTSPIKEEIDIKYDDDDDDDDGREDRETLERDSPNNQIKCEGINSTDHHTASDPLESVSNISKVQSKTKEHSSKSNVSRRGRPVKAKRGRPKTCTKTRKEQLCEAARKYRLKRREKGQKAQGICMEKQAKTLKKVGKGCEDKKPEISRLDLNQCRVEDNVKIEIVKSENSIDSNKVINNVKEEKMKMSRRNATPKARQPKKKPYDFSQIVMLVKTDSGVSYSCKTCGGSYNDKREITRHITTTHTLDTPHTCDTCRKTFKNKTLLYHHKLRHAKNFECHVCPRKFSYKYSLKEHMNSHTKTQVYICDLCSKEFLYKSTLKNHLKLHDGTRRKCVCHLCGHTFNDTTNMAIHIRTVHEKLKPYRCDLCEHSYGSKKHLVVHIRKHLGYKPYNCGNCGLSFYTGFDRNIHNCGSKDVKTTRTYKCKVCSQIFLDRSSFSKHVRCSHAGKRPYKCEVCDKDFTCKYSRDRHQLLHTGVKPFECQYCNMRFCQKTALVRHVARIHTDIKTDAKVSQQCNICGRLVANMVQHVLKCHSTNSVECEVCNKSYPSEKALNRHRKLMHTGVKFECDLCDVAFGQRYKLVKHQLKVHNVVMPKRKKAKD
ncbi:hypothetical protein evm_012216 [Chilo suppressalis]|nr:hypothetical protein evm_012216 [Chilo suppressalis]